MTPEERASDQAAATVPAPLKPEVPPMQVEQVNDFAGFQQFVRENFAAAAQEAHDPTNTLEWLWTHCRAIGMTKKSDSGLLAHDIALFTVELQQAAAAPEVPADTRDAERLDWIARNPGFSSCVVVDAPHDGEYVVMNEVGGLGEHSPVIAYGKTFREALDAAMSVPTPSTPKDAA